jgi:hypothetical protein
MTRIAALIALLVREVVYLFLPMRVDTLPVPPDDGATVADDMLLVSTIAGMCTLLLQGEETTKADIAAQTASPGVIYGAGLWGAHEGREQGRR